MYQFIRPKKDLKFVYKIILKSWYTRLLFIVYASYIFFLYYIFLKTNINVLNLDLEIDS